MVLVAYRDKAKAGNRGAGCHYSTMTDAEIMALPVQGIAAEDAALFLWATAPRLPLALGVLEALVFSYKTVAFVWEKVSIVGAPMFGLGHWTRSNAEFVLLGTRGKPKREHKGVSQIVRARRRAHSEKPAIVHEKIVQLMGDRPRCELFARRPIDGWVTIGRDIDGMDIRDALHRES